LTAAGSTLTRLLAIAGAGSVLATGHALVRTAWFGRPPVSVEPWRPSTPGDAPAPARPAPSADPEGTAPPADPAAGDPADPLDAPVKPGSITLRRAYELFQQGAFFLDARYEDAYLAGHVEGAFWMPAARVPTPAGLADLNIIDPGGTVVIYCTGGDCDASENTARRLEQAGFSFEVHILGKGYTDWEEAGLPTSAGADGGTP